MTIEDLALDYIDSLKFTNDDLVALAEDKAGKAFWKRVFKKYAPNLKVDCVPTPKIVDRTGKVKEEGSVAFVLKYLPYVSCQLVLCKDSDYDYLRQTPELNNQPYLFQTYTHSVENYLCYAPSLREICYNTSLSEDIDFDFKSFLTEYSTIIYDLFVWAFFVQADEDQDKKEIDKLFETISLPGTVTPNKIEEALATLQEKVRQKIQELKEASPNFDIDEAKQNLETLGVTPENSYLYIRGHGLQKIILSLLIPYTKHLRTQWINHLKTHYNGDDINAEIALYKLHVKQPATALQENTNYFDCFLMTKIKTDIDDYLKQCFPAQA